MKFLACLLVVAALAVPATAHSTEAIQIAADEQGLNCMLSDAPPRVVDVYVLVRSLVGVTAASFRVWQSPGFTGQLSGVTVSDASYFWLGDVESGVDVAFAACLTGQVPVARLTYVVLGTSESCSYLDVLAKVDDEMGTPWLLDCAFMVTPPAVWALAINWVNGCGICPNATQQTTWGAVKALYR